MRFFGVMSLALLVVALAATGSAAQGCGGCRENHPVEEAIETLTESGVTIVVTEGEDDGGKEEVHVESGSRQAALALLAKKTEHFTRMLRELEEAGKTEEARKLASALKQLKVELAHRRELAGSGGQATVVVKTIEGDTRHLQVDRLPGGLGRLLAGGEGDVVVVVEGAEGANAPSPGFLGIQMENAEGGVVRITGVVPGSPADRTGLQTGDVIVSLNGTKVASAEELRRLVGSNPPGAAVSVDLLRGSILGSFQVRLGERPAEMSEEEDEEQHAPTPNFRSGPSVQVQPDPGAGPARARRFDVDPRLATASGEVAQQEQLLARLNAHLGEVRARAQKALAEGQYGNAAELAQAARDIARKIEQETAERAEMKARVVVAERAAAAARMTATRSFGGGAAGAGGTSAPAGEPDAQRLNRLERRLIAMEKRLERIEHLLEKMSRD